MTSPWSSEGRAAENDEAVVQLFETGADAASKLDAGSKLDGGNGASTSRRPQTPLPIPQIATVFVLMFANSAVSTAPFPFLPFMVADLGVSLEETGSAVGLIAGARFAGNLLGSWIWGIAADRWGRRPCILLSVGSQCICSLFFAYATSKSLALASFARFLGGALNGAVPACKTYVGEITDATNSGLAMTIITASYGAGLVIGPALGGFLSSPADKYPALDTPVLRAYPYALPMVIVAAMCTVAALLGWIFLEETLDRSKAAKVSTVELVDAKATEGRNPATLSPLPAVCLAWLPRLLHDPTRFTVVLLYVVISIQGIGYDEMYNVWLAAPVEVGGMGYDTNEIGLTLIVYGVVQISVTAVVFQFLERRLGMKLVFQWMAMVTSFGIFATPLIPRAAAALGYGPRSTVTWLALVATVTISRVSNGITFVVQAVFGNNSVGQLDRGAMNGLSMTIVAAVRSVTPLFFGWTFGVTLGTDRPWPLDSSLTFTMIALVMLHASHICGGLPRSIEQSYNEPT